MQNCLKYQLL